MKVVVEWFRNNHEQRNDLLRFGFMRLHKRGEISYREYPLDLCSDARFSTRVVQYPHRHTSVVSIRGRNFSKRVIVDSQDSFFWMAPIIADCDLYLCSGYNRAFFREFRFIEPYPWQSRDEIAFYRTRASDLIDMYGAHFDRVRPFVPIGPNLGRRSHVEWLTQKVRNIRHRTMAMISKRGDWASDYEDFEVRYRELLDYRTAATIYDIVLLDSLWGWPRHRVALHQKLYELSARYKIRSQLSWTNPNRFDGSHKIEISPESFPMSVGVIADYESMLSQSRLAVFATGFHWGWRNIMTLALLIGLPVYADRLIVEPWFDIREFQLHENEDFGMRNVEEVLLRYSKDSLMVAKLRNQTKYDLYMSPESVAHYVLSVAEA